MLKSQCNQIIALLCIAVSLFSGCSKTEDDSDEWKRVVEKSLHVDQKDMWMAICDVYHQLPNPTAITNHFNVKRVKYHQQVQALDQMIQTVSAMMDAPIDKDIKELCAFIIEKEPRCAEAIMMLLWIEYNRLAESHEKFTPIPFEQIKKCLEEAKTARGQMTLTNFQTMKAELTGDRLAYYEDGIPRPGGTFLVEKMEEGGKTALALLAPVPWAKLRVLYNAQRLSEAKLLINSLGRAGKGKGVREVSGNATDARNLFDLLRGKNLVREAGPGVFVANGKFGGHITYRPDSKTGPPTVDVNGFLQGARKIKFLAE